MIDRELTDLLQTLETAIWKRRRATLFGLHRQLRSTGGSDGVKSTNTARNSKQRISAISKSK